MTRRIDALVNRMEVESTDAQRTVENESAYYPATLVLVFVTGLTLALIIAYSTTRNMARDAAALESARLAAESANRAESAFLTNMSHELRTPLNAVLGFTQVLEIDPRLDDDHREALAYIKQGGGHLLTLITDILDLAKIEAGRFDLVPRPCDLRARLHGIEAMIRVRAKAKGIGFHFDEGAGLPTITEMDEKRVREVLLNLLGNAVKFTESGGVRFSASCRAVDAVGDTSSGENSEMEARYMIELLFEVEDTGIGIAPEHLSTIFQPFRQVDSGTDVLESVAKQRPDVVFMDLKMSEMDGLETTRRLLLLLGCHDLPVIAYSAAAFAEDRESSRSAGYRRHIAKPVVAEELLQVLGDVLGLEWLGPNGIPITIGASPTPTGERSQE